MCLLRDEDWDISNRPRIGGCGACWKELVFSTPHSILGLDTLSGYRTETASPPVLLETIWRDELEEEGREE